MRFKRVGSILSLGSIVVVSACYLLSAQQPIQNTQSLSLQLKTDKEVYLPGEVISVRFLMTNESTVPLLLNRELTVSDGNLKVFIASDSERFREYIGPGWGTRDALPGEPIKLLPSQSFETEATILWNQKVDSPHLSELYRKTADKQRLNTDYALSEPCKYYLKAVLYNAQTGTTVNLAPLSIIVEEPQGGDLQIWKQLKQDPNYGFFIQTGGLLEHPKGPKTTKVANELDRLISKHPDSRYAQSIRRSLSKRQEFIERMERDNE
jgi:hypothetical protein